MPLTWNREGVSWRGTNHVGVHQENRGGTGKRWGETLDHEDVDAPSEKRRNTLLRPLLDNGKGKTSLSQKHNLVLKCQRTGAVRKNVRTEAAGIEGSGGQSDSHITSCAGAPFNDESCNDDSSSIGVEQVNTNHSCHSVVEPVPRRPHQPDV